MAAWRLHRWVMWCDVWPQPPALPPSLQPVQNLPAGGVWPGGGCCLHVCQPATHGCASCTGCLQAPTQGTAYGTPGSVSWSPSKAGLAGGVPPLPLQIPILGAPLLL